MKNEKIKVGYYVYKKTKNDLDKLKAHVTPGELLDKVAALDINAFAFF